MENNEFEKVGLYEHNIESYKKIKSAFENGEKIVGIVHATGTGKTFNALQLAYDNKDKKIIWIVPSNAIKEHVKEIIKENPRLDKKRDFPNLVIKTYSDLIAMSTEELESMDIDLLIIDEFHHLGAPIWGARIDLIIESRLDMLIFGMTAYTIRGRGTIYERDMALANGNELFSDKIVSTYDLCDAIIDEVLPEPNYISAYVNLMELVDYLEAKINKGRLNKLSRELYENLLRDAKRKIANAPSMKDVIKNNILPDEKYIYFCPPRSEKGINDIDSIMDEAKSWFKEIVPEENIVFYKTTSKDAKEGKKNRDCFYKDLTLNGEDARGKLRVMFAINQYNEGVHAPNVDGAILGRYTKSDIVFFEQLGRALAVRSDYKKRYKEYEKLTVDELITIATRRKVVVNSTFSKEKIIRKLLAPKVIDLTNNIEFIKELENNINQRIKEILNSKNGSNRSIKIKDVSFDINVANVEIFEILKYIKEKFMPMTWDSWYDLASSYYMYHNDLDVPSRFKTTNGYTEDENGLNLGVWIANQRVAYKDSTEPKSKRRGTCALLTDTQIEALERIGMIWDVISHKWEQNFKLAKSYYEHHGNLKVPFDFKTKNGYEYDRDGQPLGVWIKKQRIAYENKDISTQSILNDEKIKRLEEIGMIWNIYEYQWEKHFKLAKSYYENYGNLEIPSDFKTKNGYEYDEKGFDLNLWLKRQRSAYKNRDISKEKRRGTIAPLNEEQIKKLEEIGMIWEVIFSQYENFYCLAKSYYEHYGNLLVSSDFKTINGYEYDANGYDLNAWIGRQRLAYKNRDIPKEKRKNAFSPLNDEQVKKLEEIGMIWDVNKYQWENKFALTKNYYHYYGNLNIPINFKTLNGYEYDEHGQNIYNWISNQRLAYQNRGIPKEKRRNATTPLDDEQVKKLEEIGMIWDINEYQWENNYTLAKSYYEYHGNLNVPKSFKTKNGYEYNDDGFNLYVWIVTQRKAYKNRDIPKEKRKGTNAPLDDEQVKKLEAIGMIWNTRGNQKEMINVCEYYGLDYKNNKYLIENISYKELCAKINYLLQHDMPFSTDGVLHKLFFMSNLDMQNEFGINREILINEYYVEDNKRSLTCF